MKDTLIRLAELARDLDIEGNPHEADEITNILERIASGDEDAVRFAANYYNKFQEGGQRDKSLTNEGLWQIGKGANDIWNAIKRGAGGIGKAGIGLAKQEYHKNMAPAAYAVGKAQNLGYNIADTIRNVETPELKAKYNAKVDAAVQAAITAHKVSKNGQQTLKALLADAPPWALETARKKFFGAIGKNIA